MIILVVIVWALLGVLGNYLGWKMIDNCQYDVDVGQCLITGAFGPLMLLLSCGCILQQKYEKSKFIDKALNKVVFAKEVK